MSLRQKIFLASSAELADDRREFEAFVGCKNEEWHDQGVFLQLVIREDFLDTVAPTRRQDEYQRAIRECDLFVMLFFTKVGPHAEEEFATAFAQFKATGKPLILTCFKDSEISTGTASKKDLMSLWAFQEKLTALGHFPTVYRNVAELKLHLAQQFDKLTATPSTGGDLVQGDRILGDQIPDDRIGTQINTGGGAAVDGPLDVGGHFIGRDFVQIIQQVFRGDDPREASEVIAHYVHALATTLAQWLTRERPRAPGGRGEIDTPGETRPVSALEALAQHRQLTLLGAAGSGKSTFGSSVPLTLASLWQGQDDRLADLGAHWSHGALLPVRIVLRRFIEQLPPGKAAVHAGDLWTFIGRDLDASGYGLSTETRKYVQRIARDRGALIVLDGLDECGSDATRQRVLGAVDELIRSAGQQCRFLLTARPYAWPGKADPAQGVYALADFNDEQIEQFIHAWYAALARRQWLSPGEAERKLADLLAARQRPDLLPLSRNPLLLTLMASLHANRGRLPDDRADLYNDSVDLLMLRWNRQIGADKALLDALAIPTLKLSDLREVLEELAFAVHAESVVHDRRLDADQAATSGAGGPAGIGEGRLLQAFRPLLEGSWDKAAVVVDYIEKRAGLLLGQGDRNGERQFAFPHRTFQEFLAACHLAARQDFASECAPGQGSP